MADFDSHQAPALAVSDLTLEYPAHGGAPSHTALEGVNFEVPAGSVTALLGESGSGKSSLVSYLSGRSAILPNKHDRVSQKSGVATVGDTNVAKVKNRHRGDYFANVGYLAQDAGAHLPPSLSVAETLMRPLYQRDKELDTEYASELVQKMFDLCDLPLSMLDRVPHELSRGQRQRIAVMESLMLEPRVLIADEPTAGIDALHRPSVVQLLSWFKERTGATMVLVCHDIGMLEALADEIVVLQDGQTVGSGDIGSVFRDATHPYVQQLAAALRATAYDEAADRKRSEEEPDAQA